ncbi:hypothetical protein DEA98_13475 [Brucella pseudogrignonensis]|nr:hypothetical protein [Brucella pseudogrignonensis]
MAAVELLLTDVLAHAIAEIPELRNWLGQRPKSLEHAKGWMKRRGEDISEATHYRYLECALILLGEAKSRSEVFGHSDD